MKDKLPSMSLHIAVASKGITDFNPCISALFKNISHDIAQNTGKDLSITLHIAHDQNIDFEKALLPFEHFTRDNDNIDSTRIEVRTTRCTDSTSILKLWGIALADASSQYVAVLDLNCPPSDTWLATVADNINRSVQLFYGSVEPGWSLSNRNIIGYLVEYAQFKSPIACDSEFPGNNIVFKTNFLDSRQTLKNEGFFKTFMLWKIKKHHNTEPIYCDNMPVYYRKEFKLIPYLKRRKNHGRYFASCRHEQDDQPPIWACILFTPALFLLRTARIYKWMKYKRHFVKAFVRYLPVILISEIAWSYGEFMGYCVGENDACKHLD